MESSRPFTLPPGSPLPLSYPSFGCLVCVPGEKLELALGPIGALCAFDQPQGPSPGLIYARSLPGGLKHGSSCLVASQGKKIVRPGPWCAVLVVLCVLVGPTPPTLNPYASDLPTRLRLSQGEIIGTRELLSSRGTVSASGCRLRLRFDQERHARSGRSVRRHVTPARE